MTPVSNASLDQFSRLLGDKRGAKIKALPLATLVAFEEHELLAGFHSLSNYPLVQARTNTDHGAHDGRIARVFGDILHKRLMQL